MSKQFKSVILSTCLISIAGTAVYAAPETSKLHGTDMNFLMDSAKTNLLEVKLGELAQKKATSSDVKTFAQRMIDDHSKAQAKLQSVADKVGCPMPTAL